VACDCEVKRIETMKERIAEKHNVSKLLSVTCGDHMHSMSFKKIKGEYIKAEFIKKKTDGSEYKAVSKERLFTQYSYCPYCGCKYEFKEDN